MQNETNYCKVVMFPPATLFSESEMSSMEETLSILPPNPEKIKPYADRLDAYTAGYMHGKYGVPKQEEKPATKGRTGKGRLEEAFKLIKNMKDEELPFKITDMNDHNQSVSG